MHSEEERGGGKLFGELLFEVTKCLTLLTNIKKSRWAITQPQVYLDLQIRGGGDKVHKWIVVGGCHIYSFV